MSTKVENVDNQDVLNKEFRPDCLGDVIGQDAVVKTLLNTIISNRIPNSIILQGEKGLGKTTTGRAYVHTINCDRIDEIKAPFVGRKNVPLEELKKHIRPCGECDTCKEYAKAPEFAGLTELDAGSEGKVDEVRSLKETLRYSSNSKYKAILIDEAHNMSNEGNTALLKVVEEPPKHVLFMFATTHPDSLLPTIKSRSLTLKFRGVEDELIEDRLRFICEKKGIEISDDALKAISSSTNGGVRDAIKNLEHASLKCLNEKIELKDLEDIVEVEPEYVQIIIDLMFNGTIEDLLKKLNEVSSSRKLSIENSHLDFFLNRIRTKMYTTTNKNDRNLLTEVYKIFIGGKERFLYNVPARTVIEAAVLEAFNTIEDSKILNVAPVQQPVNIQPVVQTVVQNPTSVSKNYLYAQKVDVFTTVFKLIFGSKECQTVLDSADVVYIEESNTICIYVPTVERVEGAKAILRTPQAQGIKQVADFGSFLVKVKN